MRALDHVNTTLAAWTAFGLQFGLGRCDQIESDSVDDRLLWLLEKLDVRVEPMSDPTRDHMLRQASN